jgi:hypothetical protein
MQCSKKVNMTIIEGTWFRVLTISAAMDATLMLVAGKTAFKMRHMDSGFFNHSTRNPIFGHVASWYA